jgi:hypothetical protein
VVKTLSRTVPIAVLLALPGVASASEGLGLNFAVGDGARVGATLKLTPRLAVRPSLVFSRLDLESAPALYEVTIDYPVEKTHEVSLGTGVDVLCDLTKAKDVTPYVGMGMTYWRLGRPYQTLEGNAIVIRNGTLRQTDTVAIFGLRYTIGRRLWVYGEAGLGYSYGERFGFGGRRLRAASWGTNNAGLGAVFLFSGR